MKIFEFVLSSNLENKLLTNSAKKVAEEQEHKKFLKRLAKYKKENM